MPKPQTTKSKTVVVTGDLTIDWNLLFFQSTRDTTSLWAASNVARACSQPGGVAMLAALIETITTKLNPDTPIKVYSFQPSKEAIHPEDKRFNQSYAIWSLFGDKEPKAWRVSQFLGIDPADIQGDELKLVDDPEAADLIVLDDANRGYCGARNLWPRSLDNLNYRSWIVLKSAYPVAKGDLWDYLVSKWSDRLIVVAAANDLRLSNAQISRGLSWERLAQDTLWELYYNPEIKELSRATHVVVSFQTDGAVLVSRTGKGLEGRLIFDPDTIENGWSAGYQGGMVGFNTCLTGAIVRNLLVQGENEITCDMVARGVHAGLSAMRALHSKGFESRGAKPDIWISFPYDLVASEIEKPNVKFAQTDIQDPLSILYQPKDGTANLPRTRMFSILAQQCRNDLLPLARSIVKNGPEKALSNIPLGKFGKLLTVDRNEIESYRTIAALIQEYISQEKLDKPISIAVFGAPGSGKSYGIKEIANSLSDRIEEITFNLAQMNSAEDLFGAFHQVRDKALRGKIPLVFWDEFDSTLGGTPLGWLRYFLAPMQDGSFLEGQLIHPIGRAIFVFAGGTCECIEEFGKKLDADARINEELFRAVKGPDFISRLKGFINILGPNPQKGVYDPFYIIRRAILLSAILHRLTPPQFFSPTLHMDDNLLDAFLETQTYWHGVRSIESVVSMSQLSGKTRFERSCLPPISQLNLHVIGREFMARVQKLKFEGEALDKLTRAVHEDFCEYMQSPEKGYHYGEKTDDDAKTHSSLKPFDDLPPDEKDQNKQNALDIPNKLARVGYVMVHARTNEPPLLFPGKDLDALAEMEHIRWVKMKLAQQGNWHYGTPTDKKNHVHADLLPWKKMSEAELAQKYSPAELAAMGREELSEVAKEKDRELIRRIPQILARVGYTVVKLESSE
ncbi:MAG: hypothetical protein MUO64_12665 [Anaerolineales bacterium]|nr:hypothetical protein [Anaerolineales bacterium]